MLAASGKDVALNVFACAGYRCAGVFGRFAVVCSDCWSLWACTTRALAGSGNPGRPMCCARAPKWPPLTLLLDALKGLIPVLVVKTQSCRAWAMGRWPWWRWCVCGALVPVFMLQR